ncbi:MAG TPA: hypothetical protein VF434_05495, partial [Promineifilum sp.]
MDEPRPKPETVEDTSTATTRPDIDDEDTPEPQAGPLTDDDTLSPLAGAPPPQLPALRPAAESTEQPPPADPEFDAYMAVIRL